jgi:hypothetical protein
MNVAQLSLSTANARQVRAESERAGTSIFYCCAIPEVTFCQLNAKQGARSNVKWQCQMTECEAEFERAGLLKM